MQQAKRTPFTHRVNLYSHKTEKEKDILLKISGLSGKKNFLKGRKEEVIASLLEVKAFKTWKCSAVAHCIAFCVLNVLTGV